jgi:hypothetical protein
VPDGVGTTHHVKIGDQYHLLKPGTYRKLAAPLFGPRFTTGDPDFNTLSLWQHWVQHCWIGGFGADTWRDDAMFHQGVGVDTMNHESLRLCHDMNFTLTGGLDGATIVRRFASFNNQLWCLEVNNGGTPRLHRWQEGTGWVVTVVFTGMTVSTSMTVFGGYLIIGTSGGNLYRVNTSNVVSTFAKGHGETITPGIVASYRDRLYVTCQGRIYRYKPDFTLDGSTVFYTSAEVNNFSAAEVHQGFLYLGSENGRILRCDGNNTFDLWGFDGFCWVVGLRSYDGRLFVSTVEGIQGALTAGGGQEGVLYQFSGAALTELKRFGKDGVDANIGNIRTINRRLFFGASSLFGFDAGFGIGAYDAVEDAVHVFAANEDAIAWAGGTFQGRWIVDDVAWHDGWLYAAVRGHGTFRTPMRERDIEQGLVTYDMSSNGASPDPLNGGWLSSSDFDAGTPGLQKLWRSITVHADLPVAGCTVVVETSTNGGVSWSTAGTATKSGAATRYATEFILDVTPGVPLRSTRLKYRLTLRTTDVTKTPVVLSVSVKYLPIPDPGWRWDLRLVLSDTQELLDGTIQTVSVATKLAALETAFRTQTPLYFKDIDSTEWTASAGAGVLITDMSEEVRHIGPTSDGVIEREVRLVLMEIVEAYEA